MAYSSNIVRFAAGAALLLASASPLLAQTADPNSPAAPAASDSVPGPAPVTNGPTKGSDTEVMDDRSVFNFDISMGSAGLTDEQRLAARNTCNESVMTNPTRYSTNVKTFCQQLQ